MEIYLWRGQICKLVSSTFGSESVQEAVEADREPIGLEEQCTDFLVFKSVGL